ncbi:uncharacterized protein C17orf80 homolog isoform X2 [Poecile atricapillus]|uniref:uncharacterized protein C17orf80 homolog isoform X2 n=1 Tax=Poecile atricapillus TaxID=48891 RepID=UPI0027397198|nr:uncharacterized protein C17orf80 homolog isoform X2 [Poecile atricapillus]
MAAGTELCPHCQRPFKRLRAHLPHCRAAPAPGPGPAPAPGPGPASAARPPPAPPSAKGRSRQPSPATASRAVRDVARSLDLHPEEVRDVPGKLQKGVKVVIERNRARVLREKEPRSGAGAAGSGGGRTEPGPAPHPQRRKTAPKSTGKETPSQGAAGSGSSKGQKSGLKATKAPAEPPGSRNGLGDLVQRGGRDKSTAGEERGQLEIGVGSEPPASASHPRNLLRLSLTEALGGHGQGTSRNELSSLQRPRDIGEQLQGAPEPTVSLGTAPQLALLHIPKIQPPCSAQASGLEWFPELYPDYEGLRIFPGKRFHEDVRIAAQAPQGAFTQGQQGPLSERPLMEVRLGELHTWISTCNFSPQGLLAAAQRAWSSYCAKYIHVRQGGPAGISMLLAGYCLLSYGWNYQHLKRHRWRKYH